MSPAREVTTPLLKPSVGGGTGNNALRPFDASPGWASSQVREKIGGTSVREVGTTDLWLPAA
jgi:hypothetical protein